jgi:hypothetical protein
MTASWRHGMIRCPADSRPAVRVIKVGGSLLDRLDWPRLIGGLVAESGADSACLLVVGGGSVVESLRESDARSPHPAERMHRAAIDVMGGTGWLVARLLELPFVREPGAGRTAVLDVPAWLGREGRLERLPAGWNVTSDSIAADVAACLHAALLLAKSGPPPDTADCHELAERGWVDGYFPEAAALLREIAWACPRSVPPPARGGAGREGGGASDRRVG